MKDKNLYLSIGAFWVLVFIVFFASGFYRYHQFQKWKEHSSVYFVDNYPAMTTLDAYYWLRYAKEYKNGTYYKDGKDKLRAYPEGTDKPKPVPLISFIIVWISKIFDSSIYVSGLIIIPLFASLFIIPLALYGWEIDTPIAGIVGGFVGAFSWMYAIRTAMGRVDTDLLQLFFLFSGSLLLLKVSKTQNEKRRYIYSALLGLNFFLFGWWYAHFGIDLVYLVVMVFMLAVRRIGLKQSVVSVILFILFANPVWVFHSLGGLFDFVSSYGEVKTVGNGNFPNILKTITEAEHISAAKVLSFILSFKALNVLGLLFTLVFLFSLKLDAVPILPVFLLGLLVFKSSNRLVMFLAPFIGIGLGFAMDLTLKRVFKESKFDLKAKSSIASFAVLLLIGAIGGFTAYKFVPSPSIAAPIVKSFVDIKHRFDKGVIFSWWDYGYAIEDIDGFATYHDGGVHGGARTYLVAKALIGDNQTLMHNIIAFMDANGVKPITDAIKDNKSASYAVKLAFNYDKPIKDKDNYVLFTQDMIGKYYAISYLGSWDFEKKRSYPDGFYVINSCYGYKNGVFLCRQGNIDLKSGAVGNLKIKRWIWVVDGVVKQEKIMSPEGVNVEICFVKNREANKMDFVFALVCDDKVFRSNFNKMFILGEYNHKLFEEVYNNFPFARLFRVK
ncbi:STT3 domain-containing protein [Hippea alviniae]|uniref:STT3 domain-containing protein n=1 Tax=Hippea alviniae TaxID=1279027 RepID=UPI0003B31F6B|nr:STT3 domain-containing protein [Hippea alviniae]